MEGILGLLATIGSPVVVTALVDWTKRNMLSSLVKVTLIRWIVALLSLVAAFLTLWVGDAANTDALTDAINIALLTGVNFFAATGIFHLRKN
jgi:hypothetical protein